MFRLAITLRSALRSPGANDAVEVHSILQVLHVYSPSRNTIHPDLNTASLSPAPFKLCCTASRSLQVFLTTYHSYCLPIHPTGSALFHA